MSERSSKITDKRQYYLGKLLREEGFEVYLAEERSSKEKEQLFSKKNTVPFFYLLPVPVSTEELDFLTGLITSKDRLCSKCILLGGNFPKGFTDLCAQKEISCIDYMHSETVAMGNAVATAECIIAKAALETPINLQGSKALVIGYGKCGEILAEKLEAWHVKVYVSTRNPAARKKAECHGHRLHEASFYPDYHFIFNTAPAPVLSSETIDRLRPDTAIFDLASKPGGTDFSYCQKKGIQAGLYPGLPGKYSPQTSAKIIFEYLQEIRNNIGL